MKAAWSRIEKLLETSKNEVVYDKKEYLLDKEFIESSINQDSVLGQVIKNISSVTVNGYLRVFGNGLLDSGQSIFFWNKTFSKFLDDEKLLIASDIWGGLFAINNDHSTSDIDSVWYFAPDTLAWESVGITYAEFFRWILNGDLNTFFKSYMWKGYKSFIKNISLEEGVLIYPFLWSRECIIDLAEKTVVPLGEIVELNYEHSRNFDN